MNNLEKLLNESERYTESLIAKETEKKDNCEEPCGGKAVNMQRAKKGASLYDFLDMLAIIVDYAMADMNVKFITDEEEIKLKDPELSFDQPHISYRVISRKPNNEYKPIVREEIVEHIAESIRQTAAAGSHFSRMLTPEEEEIMREIIREFMD